MTFAISLADSTECVRHWPFSETRWAETPRELTSLSLSVPCGNGTDGQPLVPKRQRSRRASTQVHLDAHSDLASPVESSARQAQMRHWPCPEFPRCAPQMQAPGLYLNYSPSARRRRELKVRPLSPMLHLSRPTRRTHKDATAALILSNSNTTESQSDAPQWPMQLPYESLKLDADHTALAPVCQVQIHYQYRFLSASFLSSDSTQ
ncbi:hypothetical protein WMY93_018574 [Mugilogobius chulae]|uniref:Uncharacterized protein n=1 Tax=Mugilogobius chulae TaxID=88201 RepID=A0AAW0NJ98_9GOBI